MEYRSNMSLLTWPILSEDDEPLSVLFQLQPQPRAPELRPPFVVVVRVPHLVAQPLSVTSNINISLETNLETYLQIRKKIQHNLRSCPDHNISFYFQRVKKSIIYTSAFCCTKIHNVSSHHHPRHLTFNQFFFCIIQKPFHCPPQRPSRERLIHVQIYFSSTSD